MGGAQIAEKAPSRSAAVLSGPTGGDPQYNKSATKRLVRFQIVVGV